jgi:hypothetical protein
MEVDYGHSAQAKNKAGQMEKQTYDPKPGDIKKSQRCLSSFAKFVYASENKFLKDHRKSLV